MYTTLQIKDSVWKHANAYAQSRGEELSTIVEQYLMSLDVRDDQPTDSVRYYVSPKLEGFISGKDYGKDLSDDYKEELLDALSAKYQ